MFRLNADRRDRHDHDAPDAPRTTLWFALPALAVLVLPLFARRRFPFAAPVVFWLIAAAVTFVD